MDYLVLLAKPECVSHLKRQKMSLLETFEGKDLGQLQWFLNIKIIRSLEEKRITVLQSSYIDNMIQKYQINSSRHVSTPLSHLGGGPAPSKGQADSKYIQYYQSVIRSLIYILIISRPDVSFAVNVWWGDQEPTPQKCFYADPHKPFYMSVDNENRSVFAKMEGSLQFLGLRAAKKLIVVTL